MLCKVPNLNGAPGIILNHQISRTILAAVIHQVQRIPVQLHRVLAQRLNHAHNFAQNKVKLHVLDVILYNVFKVALVITCA